jgi:hypothetical protein
MMFFLSHPDQKDGSAKKTGNNDKENRTLHIDGVSTKEKLDELL